MQENIEKAVKAHASGLFFAESGDFQKSLPFYKTALRLNPRVSQYWGNYIDALLKLNRTRDAILVLKQARDKGAKGHIFEKLEKRLVLLSKNPGPEVIDSLISCHSKGMFQHVIDRTGLLLQEFPYSFILLNLRGACFAALRQFDAAIVNYQEAVKIEPDNAEGYNNIGVALKQSGNSEAALRYYQQALEIKSDYVEAYHNLSILLSGKAFKKPYPRMLQIIDYMLNQQALVRPSEIGKAAVSLLKYEPGFSRALEVFVSSKGKNLMIEVIESLSALPALLSLMNVWPIADIEVEKLLMRIRSNILLFIFDVPPSQAIINFQSALALQCFTNEYVYSQSNAEVLALEELETAIKRTFAAQKQPDTRWILCLASYRALGDYDWYDSLIVTGEINAVYTRQIKEPRYEELLKDDIPTLGEVTDNISKSVREQYEANPYPRWVNIGLPQTSQSIEALASTLEVEFFDTSVKGNKKPQILIAGCGTGQHSITTANRFRDAEVLAVDLSLSSLAYAVRKTEELGLTNIRYMHADILDLDKLGRQFDIVESVGVLHHMSNPMDGWNVLTRCLKTSGLMKIGLYSQYARQDIDAVRKDIQESGLGATDSDMRSVRERLISQQQNHHKQVMSSTDFYSLSTVRDLLFHVKEHCFTLPEIEDRLHQLNLVFCGFELDGLKNPSNDLLKWHSYEKQNPRTFVGMYQFWCQKTV
ncbi:MAG: tetratricopeptide repeat protein [Gammaproteobacteria bacterium]|nr:tetratricopeptide repeat protein [Gammaproteobacteria bacterium]